MNTQPDSPLVRLDGVQAGDIRIGNVVKGNMEVHHHHAPAPQPGLFSLHQLRAPVSDFVGRSAEIATLSAALQRGDAASISGLAGMGGVGKTELALLVAHRLRDHYPDAQIMLHLQGSRDPAMPATQALQQVISAFVPDPRLPDTLTDLTTLYRSILTGKRVLILADDAKDAAQVQALLPPAGSALLITSRQKFTLKGMQRIDLTRLEMDEAGTLLRTICPRLDAAAAQQIAASCGCLPLALRIAASLLNNDATLRTADYIARLSEQKRTLMALKDPDSAADPEVDVEASIALSYHLLTPQVQATLAQLGVFGASFCHAAAAAVVQPDDPERLRDDMSLLYRRSLLEYHPEQERYDLHELVRLFALQRLGEQERAARLRYATYYIAAAKEAQQHYLAGGDQIVRGLAHFERERANLDAARRWLHAHAGSREVDTLLIDDADATAYIGELRYHPRSERIPQLEAALAAARRLGRRGAEGWFLGNLGLAYAALGEPRRAIEIYEQRLVIAREIGDRRGEGNALGNLGLAYAALGEPRRAIAYHEQALVVSRELGDRRAEGQDLGNLGLAYADLGEPRRAIEYYEQQLTIVREIGDRRGEGAALGNLGLAYADLSEPRRAIGYYEQQLTITREIGDRRGEGNALGSLGLAYAALGEPRRAIEYYEQVLDMMREIGDRRGEAIASWNLGIALVGQGQVSEALGLLDMCVAYEQELGHPDAEEDARKVAYVREHGKWPG
nr:tetratricopeptide repeat protein [Oscillochloris trichoides]